MARHPIVGKRLCLAMARARFTRKQLASKSGLDEFRTLCAMQGDGRLTVDELARIAHVLDCELSVSFRRR